LLKYLLYLITKNERLLFQEVIKLLTVRELKMSLAKKLHNAVHNDASSRSRVGLRSRKLEQGNKSISLDKHDLVCQYKMLEILNETLKNKLSDLEYALKQNQAEIGELRSELSRVQIENLASEQKIQILRLQSSNLTDENNNLKQEREDKDSFHYKEREHLAIQLDLESKENERVTEELAQMVKACEYISIKYMEILSIKGSGIYFKSRPFSLWEKILGRK